METTELMESGMEPDIEPGAADLPVADGEATDLHISDEPRPSVVNRALGWCGRRREASLSPSWCCCRRAARAVSLLVDLPSGPADRCGCGEAVVDAAKGRHRRAVVLRPGTANKDLDNAKSHLTGEFLTYYSQFTDTIVAGATKKGRQDGGERGARGSLRDASGPGCGPGVRQPGHNQQGPAEPGARNQRGDGLDGQNSGRWLISEFKPV